MARLLDALSFGAPFLEQQTLVVDEALLRVRLGELLDAQDLSQFIL